MSKRMKEVFFLIEEAEEDGYIASALGQSIITEADTLEELKTNIREATVCHFDDGKLRRLLICTL